MCSLCSGARPHGVRNQSYPDSLWSGPDANFVAVVAGIQDAMHTRRPKCAHHRRIYHAALLRVCRRKAKKLPLAELRSSRGRLIFAVGPPQDFDNKSGRQAHKEQACDRAIRSDQPSAIWWHHIAVTERRQDHDGQTVRWPKACHHVQRHECKRPNDSLNQQRAGQKHLIPPHRDLLDNLDPGGDQTARTRHNRGLMRRRIHPDHATEPLAAPRSPA